MTKKKRPTPVPADTELLPAADPPLEASPLEEFAPNPRNPRLPWKPEQQAAFIESLRRFGDLGGIVRNLTTGQLVGGHKRVEVFRSSADVRIVATPQPRDAQGTVAHGSVIVDGTRFSYREVEWSPEVEAAANLAANRWTAGWDWSLVSETLKSITDTELHSLTGFASHELANLLAAEWNPETPGTLTEGGPDRHAVVLTATQYEQLRECGARLKTELAAEAPLADAVIVEHLCARFLALVPEVV
jgi:hypothetical protein